MLKMIEDHSERLSLWSMTFTIVTVAVHHVFRLGPELTLPGLVGLALPAMLIYLFRRTGRRAFIISYGVYAGLVVFWFGVLDGFLDHVLKSAGVENITFLPGSDVPVVATVYQLWSQEASTLFYEGTGVLSAVGALALTITTAFYLARALATAAAQPG